MEWTSAWAVSACLTAAAGLAACPCRLHRACLSPVASVPVPVPLPVPGCLGAAPVPVPGLWGPAAMCHQALPVHPAHLAPRTCPPAAAAPAVARRRGRPVGPDGLDRGAAGGQPQRGVCGRRGEHHQGSGGTAGTGPGLVWLRGGWREVGGGGVGGVGGVGGTTAARSLAAAVCEREAALMGVVRRTIPRLASLSTQDSRQLLPCPAGVQVATNSSLIDSVLGK